MPVLVRPTVKPCLTLVSFHTTEQAPPTVFAHQQPFLDRAASRQFGCFFAAWSAVLDRGRQVGGLFWSTNLPPWTVHLFLPRVLKTKRQCAGHCVKWAEPAWPALLCDLQSGSFKTRKQLITAVSPSLHPQTSRWATGQLLRSRRCSVSSVSVAVWLC